MGGPERRLAMKDQKTKDKRRQPVHIRLDFERAVEGLLAVDPKGPVREKPAKKKKKTPRSGR
jgi:hypothetical protein